MSIHNGFHKKIIEFVLNDQKLSFIKPWKANEALLAQNIITNNPYKGINQLLLGCQFNDPRWATIKQINQLDGKVKKGERGSKILYFKISKVIDNNGEPILNDDGSEKKIALRRYYYVFNASQCDGLEPYEYVEPSTEKLWSIEQAAEEILISSKANIFHDQADSAFYLVNDDSIHLPGKQQFNSALDYYAVAMHELAHWTGHRSRLNRDIRNDKNSTAYAREELRAELASYFLAARIKIPFTPEIHSNHIMYLKKWIQLITNKPEELISACKDAELICDYLQSFVSDNKSFDELKKAS